MADDISVLTIEDDEGLRRSISTYLEDSGFTVYEAGDGQEGLQLFRQHQPDIVFTDLSMPSLGGLELLPIIREESPLTPVVVISGTGVLTDAVNAMKLGAWDYIDKPVRELSILEKISRKLVVQAAEQRRQQEELEQNREVFLHYDVLTGLPNRALLVEHFERIKAENTQLCIIHLDLDNFKMMNASLGLLATDQLLQELSARLKKALCEQDMLARIGSDEFVVLSMTGANDLETLIKPLQAVFHEPFTAPTGELFLSCCMGVVIWPDDGECIEDLLKHADMSTLQARERGRRNVQFYNPQFGAHVRQRIELESSLRRALERNEFTLYYQPQIEISTGIVAGLETLIRWRHSDGHLVSPAEFIPVLEDSGLIIPVGEWILRSACSQYMAWRRQGMPPITISVNISAPQFKSGSLPSTITKILAETGMDPHCLCIELTESIVMEDIDETINTLNTLRRLGLHLSIDDFGTGYSSLNYLSSMPITELKIDRSFISTITYDRNNALIVNTIISMANSLNLRVVAEGVETIEQLLHLSSKQCKMVQGFYFSKPLPAEELLQHLDTYRITS